MKYYSNINYDVKEEELNNFDFSLFETTENDSAELHAIMNDIELSDSIFGVMGWGDYTLFNIVCRRVLLNTNTEQDREELEIIFKKYNVNPFDSRYDFSPERANNVSTYVYARCIPCDTYLFNNLTWLRTHSDIHDIFINHLVKRIAIEQWEAVKYKFIDLVQKMKIGVSIRNLLIENLLCPLYEKDQRFDGTQIRKYSTEFGATSSKFIKSIIIRLNDVTSIDNKKIMYRIARHIELLKKNLAVEALIKLNINSVINSFFHKIKNLIKHPYSILHMIQNSYINVQYTLKTIMHGLVNPEHIDFHKFDLDLKKGTYLLREDHRILKLTKVLGKKSREATRDYIKIYNTVYEKMKLYFS